MSYVSLGYAAFKVADTVQSFQGYGMGSYIFTNVNPGIHVSHTFEVPRTPGVQLHDLLTSTSAVPAPSTTSSTTPADR